MTAGLGRWRDGLCLQQQTADMERGWAPENKRKVVRTCSQAPFITNVTCGKHCSPMFKLIYFQGWLYEILNETQQEQPLHRKCDQEKVVEQDRQRRKISWGLKESISTRCRILPAISLCEVQLHKDRGSYFYLQFLRYCKGRIFWITMLTLFTMKSGENHPL